MLFEKALIYHMTLHLGVICHRVQKNSNCLRWESNLGILHMMAEIWL